MAISSLNRYIEQTLRYFNNIDSIMIVDTDRVIRYYYSAYPDVSGIKERSNILGKTLLEAYPDLNENDSYIIRCINTGKAIMNYEQNFTNYLGVKLRTVSSAVPIHDKGELVAVADISVYPDKSVEEKNIFIDASNQSQEEETQDTDISDIITCNPKLKHIKQSILDLSDSDAPVMVYGKTGTGKELIVNAIHRSSKRKNGPLITQNCAAIPATLLESILFGNVKGSFTGAGDSEGLFEMANHGTLFLDEINSMEIEAQAKILRAIEDRYIRRIGDKKERKIDVRIIAALNEDPIECVKNKKIREDLYYRLNVIRYDLPELKERKEDIPLLMEYFREKFNQKFDKNIMGYTNHLKTIFLRYNWPGNVRELKNAIEAAYHMNYGAVIGVENIPKHIREHMNIEQFTVDDTENKSLESLVWEFEKQIIERKYEENGRKLSQTARALSISRQSLRYKLHKYGLADPDDER